MKCLHQIEPGVLTVQTINPHRASTCRCFVGKRRLERAILAVKDELNLSFEVQWHPFFLDPTLPVDGVNKLESYKKKFGEARMAQMLPQMQRVGLEDGITFSYGGKIAHTLDSHRIMELAFDLGGAALQDKVCEALFHYYFEAEGNLGDHEKMIQAVSETGIDVAAVRALLASDDKRADIAAAVRKWATKYSISGVPYFIIDGKYKLSGAQDPDNFIEIFRELASTKA